MNAPIITTAPGSHRMARLNTYVFLALASVDTARAQLDRYALATDAPAWQAVDAADALDTARALLAKAVSHG